MCNIYNVILYIYIYIYIIICYMHIYIYIHVIYVTCRYRWCMLTVFVVSHSRLVCSLVCLRSPQRHWVSPARRQQIARPPARPVVEASWDCTSSSMARDVKSFVTWFKYIQLVRIWGVGEDLTTLTAFFASLGFQWFLWLFRPERNFGNAGCGITCLLNPLKICFLGSSPS